MLNNNRIGTLHFWCQKVLPCAYDNSLSYYEVLLKLKDKLNEVIHYTNEIPEYIDKKVLEAFDDEHLQELISEVFLTIEDAITANNEGTNTHFSQDYPTVGTLVWHDNKLYRTMHAIDEGDTIIPNSNIELVNFGDMFNEFLTEVKTRFTDNDDGLRETSSADRPVHDLVWLNDELYEVIKPIAEGNAYIYTGANKNVESTNLDKIYDYLLDLISSEIETREHDDDVLQDNIDAEALAREQADGTLQDNIDAEALAREQADSTLQDNIDAEALAREQADGTLQDNIDAEALAREQADGVLQDRIDELAGSGRIITPEQFGAVGDGETDDTLAVQQAITQGILQGKTVMLTNKYLVNTLLVNGSVEICGGGTLLTPPFRYDITGSVLNNDNRYFTTSHPEYYHPNTFITVGNWQALVVTEVNGNEIHVAPTYVENETDTVVTKAAGSKVAIHKQCFWIAKQQTFSSVVLPVIKNIDIHDITIIGNQSGYSEANETVMDYRQNAHISAYSCEELRIHHCTFDVCQTNCVGVYGIQNRCYVTNNVIKNCKCANVNTSRDYLETAGAICFHYDSKFIVATNAANNCVIEGNIIDNCFEGIFMSAASFCTIANNIISNCTSTGVTIYHGDYAFNCRNNIVTGNVIEYCSVGQDGSEVGAIKLSGAVQTIVSNNNILVGTTGVFIYNSEDSVIENNMLIAQTGTCIYFYSGVNLHIKNNTFNASNTQHILLFVHTGNGGANITGNTHEGTPSNKYINLVECTNVFIANCNIANGILSRLMTISQYITSGHNVLVKDCYVSQGIAETTAEANRIHYDNCVNYNWQILSNTTTP